MLCAVITSQSGVRLVKSVQQFRPRSARGVRPFVNPTAAPASNGDGTNSEEISWMLADGITYRYRSWHVSFAVVNAYDNQLNLTPPFDAHKPAGGLFYNAWMRGACFFKAV